MPTLLRRLLDPLGLLVFGAGVATTALTGELWLVPMGVAGWALLSLGRDRTPNPDAVAPASPVGEAMTGPRALTQARLQKLAGKIEKAVAEAAPSVRVYVEELPTLAQALVTECRSLLAKLSTLDLFLAETANDDPRAELENARRREQTARDESVRQRWAQARSAAEARVAELGQIETNCARLEAELAEAEARLKHVHSRIVSLDSRDEESLTGLAGELRGALGELTQQISVSERILPTASRDSTREEPGRTSLPQ